MAEIGIKVVINGTAEARRNLGAINSDLNNLSNTIGKLSGTSTTLGQNLSRLGSALIGVGRTLTIAVTAPILAAGTAAITAGINFEDAFADVGKTVEGISDSMGQLTDVGQKVRDEFRQMALEIPIATNELAELGGIVGQLGVQAEDVGEVTRLIAMLGATTELTGEQAAKGLIRFKNIIGDTSTDIVEFIESAGSAVVALGNASVSTEGEILDLTLRLAAAGDRAKFSAQEVLAWATTLSDLGVRAESGGSAVSRAINEMVLAVQTGSDNLGTFASVSGKTVDQFVQDFEVNASDALLHFIGKLEEGIRTGKVTKEMLADLGLSGVRAADILGRLGDAQDIFNKNLGIANKSWAEQIALQEEFNKRAATVKSMIQVLKNNFTDLGIVIFDLVKDDLVILIKGISDLIQKFKEIDPETQKTILALLALAATLGPLLIVIGGMIAGLGLIVTGVAALLSPVGLAALAIGGLAAALGALVLPGLIGDLDKIKNKALEIAKALGFVKETPADPMAAAAKEHGAPVPETALKPTTAFQLPDFDTLIKGIKELGGKDLSAAIDSVVRVFDNLRDVFERFSKSKAAKELMETLSKNFERIKDALGSSLQKGLQNFTDKMGDLGKFIEDNGPLIDEFIVNFAKGVGILASSLTDVILGLDKFGQALKPFTDGTFDGALLFIKALLQLGTGDFSGAIESLNEISNIIREMPTKIGLSLAFEFSEDILRIKEELIVAFDKLLEDLDLQGLGFPTGQQLIDGIILGIQSNASLIVLNVAIAVGAALLAAQGFVGGFIGAGALLVFGLISGFAGGAGGLIAAAAMAALGAVMSVLTFIGSMLAAGMLLVTAVAIGVLVGAYKVATNIKTAIADAIEAGLTAAAGAGGIGAAIIGGIIGGVVSGAGALAAAIEKAVKEGIAAGFAAADAESPSKIMIELGGFLMEGMKIGITEGAPAAETAMSSATNSIMNTVVAALNSVAAPAGSVNNSTTSTNFQFGDITGSQITDENSLASVLNQRLTLLGAS